MSGFLSAMSRQVLCESSRCSLRYSLFPWSPIIAELRAYSSKDHSHQSTFLTTTIVHISAGECYVLSLLSRSVLLIRDACKVPALYICITKIHSGSVLLHAGTVTKTMKTVLSVLFFLSLPVLLSNCELVSHKEEATEKV